MALICLPMSQASAEVTWQETQKLDFGKWLVLGNRSVEQIEVFVGGGYTNTSGVVMLEPPQPAIYELEGLPPFIFIYDIQITVTDPLSPDLTVENFGTQSNATNADGETTLRIGATVTTSGDGNQINDGSYAGNIEIQLIVEP